MTEPREQSGGDTNAPDERDPRNRRGTPIAELERELKNMHGGDESIAELLANNWQRFIVGLGLALLAVWLYNEYSQAKITRQYSASEYFSAAQSAFGKITAAPTAGDSQSDARRLFEENIRLLRSSNSNELYAQLADLYQAQQLIAQNQHSDAAKLLTPFLSAAKKAKRSSLEALSGDLAALIQARSFVSQGMLTEARASLIGVIERGGVGSVEAAVAFASLIESEEQKQQLLEVAKRTNAKYPELSELLIAELQKVGLSFIQ